MPFGRGGNAGTVEVDVEGNFGPFERDLKNKGKAAGSRFGSSFGDSFGSKVAGLGATYLGAQFGRQVIGEASDLAEAVNVTGLAFGDAREQADTFGRNAADAVGLAESKARDLQASLGNVIVGFGADQTEAVQASEDLIRRAADIGSAWNAGTDEVSDAIIAAFTTSTEPIRRFGVIIDQAGIKQEAVRLGLIKQGEELDNNSKRLAVTSLIMEQTNNVAGDFKNTQDGVANSAKTASAMWTDMQAQLGQGLLPVLSEMLKVVRALGPDGMKMVVMGGAAILVFTKLATAAQAFGAALKLLAANPWVLVALAIVAVGILIWRNWDTIVEKLAAAWEWIKGAAGELADWFTARWEDIKRITTEVFDAIVGFFQQWWPLLLVIFAGGIGLIIGLIIQNWDAISAKVSEVSDAIVGFVQTAWDTVWGIITGIGGNVVDFIVGIPSTIAGAFVTLADTISAPFRAAFDGIKAAWNSTVGGFGFDVPGWVPGVGGKGFHVPSMATGAVVSTPTVAVVGDAGPGNREIVTPESLLRDTVLSAIAETARGAPAADNGPAVVVNGPLLAVDGNSFADPNQLERHGTELLRVVNREIDRNRRAAGRARRGVTV